MATISISSGLALISNGESQIGQENPFPLRPEGH